MAVESNAFATYNAVGNKEDVHNMIYNVAPFETPFMNTIGTRKVNAVYHEWQTDTLASPSASNAVEQGAAITTAATTPTTRLGNYTQISRKDWRIDGTQEAVDHYGRDSEFNYQKARAGKALKTDMESAIMNSQARVAPASGTAPKLAGYEAWVKTNTSRGAGGANPTGDGTDTATDGTQRSFTEALLKNVLQSAWTNGGQPTYMFAGAFNKQVFSGFAGNATRFDKAEDNVLHTNVDIYVSDFGRISAVPSRHIRSRSVFVVQPDMWEVGFLRPIQEIQLGITGDSKPGVLITEYTLVAKNEKASGIVADLTTA